MRVYFAASVSSIHAKFTLIHFYRVTEAIIKVKNIATPDTVNIFSFLSFLRIF